VFGSLWRSLSVLRHLTFCDSTSVFTAIHYNIRHHGLRSSGGFTGEREGFIGLKRHRYTGTRHLDTKGRHRDGGMRENNLRSGELAPGANGS
ncbi:hypothetical protein KUCAC02_006250, partial [Chaenocephalus aceratus]